MQRFAIKSKLEGAIDFVERRSIRSLILLLVVFLAANSCWRDISMFGHFHDDTLYFSSAKALAEGRGYIIPSLPGAPYQTKYPILYPWLLSWIWETDSNFPSNVRWAFWLNSLFGAAFVAGCYALVRSLGQRVMVSLLIAAACAFQPMTQFLSAALLSDIPFAAFGVWAMALAARWLDATGMRRKRLFAMVTVLAALAILTRTIGVTLAAGICVAALVRRAWREGMMFALATGAVTAISIGWAHLHRLNPAVLAAAEPGYRQTLQFYTDYAAFWRAGVPDAEFLPVMILRNCIVAILETGLMLFGELLSVRGAPLTLVPAILGILVLRAVLRRQGDSYHPAQLAFIFYLPLVAIWNFALAWRFFVLFLPLLYLGACRVFRGIAGISVRAARSESVVERGIGRVYLAALVGALLFVAYSHLWHSPRMYAEVRHKREQRVAARLSAYEWLASHAPPEARVVSYEDVLLYLHTGRRGIRPLQITTPANYDSEAYPIENETAKMTDTAKAISADFWLLTEGDWSAEDKKHVDKLKAAVKAVVDACPLAAEFADGAVSIWRLREGRCESEDR